jgi:hypothetical protein
LAAPKSMPEKQMDFLNISAEGEGSSKKFKKYRGFIGIGVIAAAVGLGSTLAANININAGPVEFGQGVAQTVSCSGDESVIVTPATSFTNAPSSITQQVITYGSDTLTVNNVANISVGMLIAFGEGSAVVTEINSDVLTFSPALPVSVTENATFTPSSGTEQTITPVSTDPDTQSPEMGASSMLLTTTTVEVGMLVSGPGIPANTTVVYTSSGEGFFVGLSKDIEYTSGEVTFRNSGQSSFELSDITVSNIPDTCTNKVFTIKIYDNESSEPLRISNWGMSGDNSLQVWWANGYQAPGDDPIADNYAAVHFPSSFSIYSENISAAYNDGYAVETNNNSDIAPGAFKVNLPITVDASKVYKITLETQDDSDSLNVDDEGWSFYDWYWSD